MLLWLSPPPPPADFPGGGGGTDSGFVFPIAAGMGTKHHTDTCSIPRRSLNLD